MSDLWQAGVELLRQSLDYLPALLLNLVLYGLTAVALWLILGAHASFPTRRTTIVVIASLLAFLLLGFLALVLALAGIFSGWLFYGLWLAGLALGLAAAVRSGRLAAAGRAWQQAAPLPRWLPVLLLLWLALYSRPFELVVGGRDPGIYINTAARIATRGGLAVPDEFFSRITPEDRTRLLYTRKLLEDQYFFPHKWPGFLWMAENAETVPQFYPYYPALMAASYVLTGFKGTLTVLPLVSLLLALVLAELATRVINHWPGDGGGAGSSDRGYWSGSVAAFALLLNPASLWFGRFANADLVFGLFILAALLFWAWAAFADQQDADSRTFHWTVSVLAFGAALLTKIDGWYVAPAVVAILMIYHPRRGRSGPFARVAWILISLLYVITIVRYNYPYVLGTVATEGWGIFTDARLAVALTVVYLVFLTAPTLLPCWLAPERITSLGSRFRLPQRGVPVAIAVLSLGIGFLFAGATTPNLSLSRSLEVLIDYIGWPMLLMTGAGIWSLWRHAEHDRLELALLALFFTGGLYIIVRTPMIDHPWNIRRAVSIAIPSLVLFAALGVEKLRAAVVARLGGPNASRTLSTTVRGVLVLSLVVPLLWRDVPIVHHTEVEGALAELEQLEAIFPADSVILADASRMLDLFAPALSIAGREVVNHYGTEAEPQVSVELRDRIAALAAVEGRPFFYVTPVADLPASGAFALSRFVMDEWQEVHLVGRSAPLPLEREVTTVPFSVYQTLNEPLSAAVIERYEAEALPGVIGQRVQDAAAGNGWARCARVGDSWPNALIFGPYRTLSRGRYVARFRLRSLPGDDAPKSDTSPALLIVQASSGRLAEADAPVAADYIDVDLPFTLSEADRVEFPVLYSGTGAIWVDRVEILHDDVSE